MRKVFLKQHDRRYSQKLAWCLQWIIKSISIKVKGSAMLITLQQKLLWCNKAANQEAGRHVIQETGRHVIQETGRHVIQERKTCDQGNRKTCDPGKRWSNTAERQRKAPELGWKKIQADGHAADLGHKEQEAEWQQAQ